MQVNKAFTTFPSQVPQAPRTRRVRAIGQKAKDKITGFQGILTGRASYLYGCDQYLINPPVDKEGKIGDACWFDEGRIEILGVGVTAESVSVEKPGGPNRDSPRGRN